MVCDDGYEGFGKSLGFDTLLHKKNLFRKILSKDSLIRFALECLIAR